MRFTFRAKLIAIVGTAAASFGIVIAASSVITGRVQGNLAGIQERYLPRVELGPRLQNQFDRIQRGLQDAVAANDTDALAETTKQKANFLEDLSTASRVLDPAKATALHTAMDDYYGAAHDVSRRLIAGETGEGVVAAMGVMQTKRARAVEAMRAATVFDRNELSKAFDAVRKALNTGAQVRLGVTIACLLLVVILSVWLSGGLFRALAALSQGFRRFGGGDFTHPITVVSNDELGDVAQQANLMAQRLGELNKDRDRADWLKAGHAGLVQELRGELEPHEAADRAIAFLARYVEAQAAVLYYADDDRTLRRYGQYAAGGDDAQATETFAFGEGLIGQAALHDQVVVVADAPADHLRIRSGLGDSAPRTLVLVPLVHAGRVTGVIELALFKPWSPLHSDLMSTVREALAIALEVARASASMRELLAETQRQADRLSLQEEELRTTNEELQSQQEELRLSNSELTHQTEELEAQRRSLEEKNRELDEARGRLEQKAAELTTVSAYKSQFLANMSHELRTPLNSMLLLSNLLVENEKGNLTEKQVEFAKTIHAAGKDLLALISQVLDLAKVESGKQEAHLTTVELKDVAERLRRMFEPLAQDKGLAFSVDLASELPATIVTDRQRLEQIVTNLVGNAIKFSERGWVSLQISRPSPNANFRRDDLDPRYTVAFAVTDTGIGIAPENQDRVFAPFEQVDAAADRRYGGTGLGLGIARQLANLLGGELQLKSVLGQGSTFTCFVPDEPTVLADRPLPAPVPAPPATAPSEAPDGDADLLLIEDDPVFAEAFGEVIRGHGLSYRVAPDGQTGLRWAKEKRPSGIILDVSLPDMDGWKIMEALHAEPLTATIPVHFVSALEESARGMAMGAVGYLTKPAARSDLIRVVEGLAPRQPTRTSRVLVVEDDEVTGNSLVKQLAGEALEVVRVTRAAAALDAVRKQPFGCIILDLSLPDMDGLELLNRLEEHCGANMPSVVVYTARALSKAEAKAIEAYTEAVVMKEGSSTERLLDEVRLFVRRLREGLGTRRSVGLTLHPADVRLEGRKVLLVDDDMRTVYALSAALRAKGVEVVVADTGHAALAALNERPDVEAVLMDIMMPEMDGYEATRRIRQDVRFKTLPIIALTAKAMKGDRNKCLEAGATDYLQKPIDAGRLLAMLQAHLSADRHGA